MVNSKHRSNAIAVTVIVPVYNASAFIERCAISLFEQTLDSIEYIFVDDASPDNSVELLQALLERYPQRDAKLLSQPQNQGPFEARKLGCQEAEGKYILHTDSDDWLDPEMIASLYQRAEQENADLVSCNFYFEEKRGTTPFYQSELSSGVDPFTELLDGKIAMFLLNKLIRKTALTQVYKELSLTKRLIFSEDWLITIPLYAYVAKKIAHLPEPLYHYNKMNSSSLTISPGKTSYYNKIFVLNFLYQFLEPKLTVEDFNKFKDLAATALILTSYITEEKVDHHLISQLDYHILSLWRSKRLETIHKAIFSFYFFHMPQIPIWIRKLRKRYRKLLSN